MSIPFAFSPARAVALLLCIGGLWLAWRVWHRHRVDRRFGVSVSSGKVAIRTGTLAAEAEYEVGLKVDLIIYGSSLVEASGAQLAVAQRTEVLDKLLSWSAARGTTIEITNDGPALAQTGA